jgi:hypothetical protein
MMLLDLHGSLTSDGPRAPYVIVESGSTQRVGWERGPFDEAGDNEVGQF